MALQVLAEPAPLSTDSDGVTRVGDTRVTLATIEIAFHQGATAETIGFPRLCEAADGIPGDAVR